MVWNYRILKESSENEEWYSLQEVYYEKDGSLLGYCDVSVSGETPEDLIKVLELMLEDAKKDRAILTPEDFNT